MTHHSDDELLLEYYGEALGAVAASGGMRASARRGFGS